MHHPGLSSAVVYIYRHIAERIRLHDLSAAAGVSTRTLGYLFIKTYGTTPMAYVKQERLNMARQLLEQANQSTETVAGIARRCGFTHMGQFSRDYKCSIGESPSETLRRSPRRRRKADTATL